MSNLRPVELSPLQARNLAEREHRERAAVRWVGQEHANGCGPATLAMLTGVSYAAACETIGAYRDETPIDWETGGCTHLDLDRALVGHGFWIQPDYRGWHERHIFPPEDDPEGDHRWELREGHVWPPRPWASVHYATVRQPSGNSHFVVLLADGRVLDPLREGEYRLGDWDEVHHVMGLMR